jgi:hypothetical protein
VMPLIVMPISEDNASVDYRSVAPAAPGFRVASGAGGLPWLIPGLWPAEPEWAEQRHDVIRFEIIASKSGGHHVMFTR